MTESSYIQRIRALCNLAEPDLDGALALAKEATAACPRSAHLHCVLGDLLQLAGDDSDALEDSLASYTRALEVDPEFSDAFSSIGYFHDVVMGDLAAAESAFRAALRAGPHEEAIVGLARVLTQLGHPRHEVAALLDSAIDPMSARVNQIRAEINDGEWDPFRG